MAKRRVPIVRGTTFGRLTVIADDPIVVGARLRRKWLCRCACGAERLVDQSDLMQGDTKSCGCYRKAFRRTHGKSKTREYKSWRSMMHRCLDPKDQDFLVYGGRGITVCERWRDFVSFLSDMGTRPTPHHTLDRIDNARGYEPGNCRWATVVEQNGNRRSTTSITHDGLRLPLTEWGRRLGVHPDTIRQRLGRGWSVADALTIPVHQNAS